MNTKDAIDHLREDLSKDKSEGSYYHTWQANIAMCFYDECERFRKANHKKSITPRQFAEVGHNAAKNFIDLLIS